MIISFHQWWIDLTFLWFLLFSFHLSPSLSNCRSRFIFPFTRFKTFAFQANSFSLFCIYNIEYRTRNLEPQKFLKGIKQYSSLRCSAVSCSTVQNKWLSVFWQNLPALAGSGLMTMNGTYGVLQNPENIVWDMQKNATFNITPLYLSWKFWESGVCF